MDTRVVDDRAMLLHRDGWLYRFEATDSGWTRVAFFTMPIARNLRTCPTRLFVGTSAWAFSSCRYANGAVTDTVYLLRSPTCLEMWDPWLVRGSGEWRAGKLPQNVGLPDEFKVAQVAAAGPYVAIVGTVVGRKTVAYRLYNADLVGLHPLLTYKGLVDWEPGVWKRGLKHALMAVGFNIPPVDPVHLPGSDCWKLFPLRKGSDFTRHLQARSSRVDGTYEIAVRHGRLAVRRLNGVVVPSAEPVLSTQAEQDYDWIGQSEHPPTYFDQCVEAKHGMRTFCRLSLLDFLRANGDGTLVDAFGRRV